MYLSPGKEGFPSQPSLGYCSTNSSCCLIFKNEVDVSGKINAEICKEAPHEIE